MNFDWRTRTSWLAWLVCQKVLRFDRLRLEEAYGTISPTKALAFLIGFAIVKVLQSVTS